MISFQGKKWGRSPIFWAWYSVRHLCSCSSTYSFFPQPKR